MNLQPTSFEMKSPISDRRSLARCSLSTLAALLASRTALAQAPPEPESPAASPASAPSTAPAPTPSPAPSSSAAPTDMSEIEKALSADKAEQEQKKSGARAAATAPA